MTSNERDQLQIFLRQVLQARATFKDTVADHLIKEACAHQPDALYLLVQRAIGTDLALQAALGSNTDLKAKLEQALTPSIGCPVAAARTISPTKPATTADSLWGTGLLGAVAGTTVGLLAGSLLFPGNDVFPDIS